MREALLTIGFLLIFAGAMGAISGSTKVTDATVDKKPSEYIAALTGCKPDAAGNCTLLQDLLLIEVISTVIALIGAALVLRNR